ncbi:MAG: cupin domain-containing protein [Methylobacter sp.]
MALQPKEEIGTEVHKLDQFFRVEEGNGETVLDGVRTAIQTSLAVVVPAGTKHNIINTGSGPLEFYTLYAPPNQRDGASTIPATTLRPTTNTSTEKRRNRSSTRRRTYSLRGASGLNFSIFLWVSWA